MLILILISMAFAALFLYIKPMAGLITYLIFDTYIGMQTTNWLPFSNIKTQLALFNQLIIFILLARAFMSKEKKTFFTKESKSLFYLTLSFICWSFLSIIWTDLPNEKYALHHLERIFKMLFFSVAIFMSVKNKKQLLTILFVGLAAFFIQNLFQILEFFANERATLQGGGVSLLVFSIIMLQKKISPVLKTFLILCIFLVVGSIFLSGTRRGMGALFIIIILTVYHNYSNTNISRLILPSAALLLSSYVFYGVVTSNRIEQTLRIINFEDKGAWGGRNILWEAGALMVYEKPIFGHGFGVSDNQMGKFVQEKEYRATRLRMHNSYLKAWAELGIVGVTLLLIILYRTVRIFYKVAFWFKHQKDWMSYALLFGTSMQLLGLSMEGFFGWSAYLDKVFWFYIALALTLHKVLILDQNNLKPRLA